MDGVSVQSWAPWSGEQIRFTTAGSVDDGKSTLIGRLLLDSDALRRDQAAALGEGDELDLAALTDGLEAEQAQGITIDVAYRYFATQAASFVIADAPGHEQYTRNMVTAASTSDVAVLVIDASRFEGELKPQTRRHAAISALMGLNVIVAVNKMDLTGWSEERFEDIRAAFRDAAGALGLAHVSFVPISAKNGDNVVRRGNPPWWAGPTLIELLETVRPNRARADGALRLPVQAILRDGDARIYAGRVEAGAVKAGDNVSVGVGASARVKAVLKAGKPVPRAEVGASIGLQLDDERDLAIGDVIADGAVRYAREIVADLCWLDGHAWTPGRRYRLRQGSLETQALIAQVQFVRDISDFSERASAGLQVNDIARVRVATREPILADLYQENPATGAFVLFDPDSNQTCAAGMIREIEQ